MDALTALEVKIRPDRERPEVSRFLHIFHQLQNALQEIDHAYLMRGSRPVWRFGLFDTDSQGVIVVRITASGIAAGRPRQDLLFPVRALVDGVEQLREAPRVPNYYFEQTVNRIADVGQPRQGVQAVSVALVNGKPGSHVALSEPVRDNARKAVQPKTHAYGSVRGTLDLMNARAARRRHVIEVGITEARTRHIIKGIVSEEMAEEVQGLWRSRVMVGGVITRNEQGQALRIDVREIEALPPAGAPLPAPEKLLGADPDWIGGRDVDEFLAEARRG
ncbi:hypothetical protein ABZ249_22980 [Nocardiopsis sp. NPDC006139]|uniref:hypothetical protein n=1 Tax=Nocardiopsis sp. NPDC006139 TaxID=3154578 RepID=UPI0033AD4D4A